MGDPTVALKIDKLTDSVKVKNANVLSLEDQFTFGVWIQPTTSVHQHQEYFLVIHIANNYALSCGNGCVQVAFRNEKPGWMWKKTGIQLIQNQWTHIAVSYDSVRRQATVIKGGCFMLAHVRLTTSSRWKYVRNYTSKRKACSQCKPPYNQVIATFSF